MAYIGKPPNTAIVNQATSQSFSGNGSTTAFTLNRSVNVGEDLEVFVNNVQQEPGSGKSYTASGTTLTFDEAPPSGTNNVYVIYRGEATINPRLEHDANAALAATTGTFSGDLTVDTNTLKVDSSNNRVGIGDATPDDTLTIYGGTAKLRVGSTDSNHVRIGRNTTSGHFEMMRTTTGATDQVFFKAIEANNGNVILQEGGGNVGIGGTPTELLYLEANNPEFTMQAASDGGECAVYFKDDDGNKDGRITYRTDYAGQTDNYMSFFTNGSERLRVLGGGGREWYSDLNEARWFTTSSNFDNPTITLFTGQAGGSHPQTCFEVEMFGNGVANNEHQVFRGGGTFNYDGSGGSSNAQNLTTYTNYHKGNSLPSAPSFSLSGNSLTMTCNRQTNYDTYRISVRTWGRAMGITWGSHD